MRVGNKILLMLLAILGLTVGAVFAYVQTLANDTEVTLQNTFTDFGDEEVTPIDADKPLTILLMGVDMDKETRGGGWKDGRSDSMILVTVNPIQKKTTMVSLSRDLRVEIANADGTSSGTIEKLNHSYFYGQAKMAKATIEKMLDTKIDKIVQINMDGLMSLVNAVGGIEVNNKLGFPISIAEHEPDYDAVVQPGKQVLNGEQALVYARMRYDDPDGDIGRQKRQREVIGAILKKLLKVDGFTQYKTILKAVSKNMKTDIEISRQTFPELLGYADSLQQIESFELGGEGEMIDEVSYQIATSEELLKIQNAIRESLGKEPVNQITTNLQVFEYLYGGASGIQVNNAYTGEVMVSGDGLSNYSGPSLSSGQSSSTTSDTSQMTDVYSAPELVMPQEAIPQTEVPQTVQPEATQPAVAGQ